jgi:hypothetical protein
MRVGEEPEAAAANLLSLMPGSPTADSLRLVSTLLLADGEEAGSADGRRVLIHLFVVGAPTVTSPQAGMWGERVTVATVAKLISDSPPDRVSPEVKWVLKRMVKPPTSLACTNVVHLPPESVAEAPPGSRCTLRRVGGEPQSFDLCSACVWVVPEGEEACPGCHTPVQRRILRQIGSDLPRWQRTDRDAASFKGTDEAAGGP